MYRADDSLALPGQAAQQAHHGGRHEGVQTARRLITEEERWVSQNLQYMILSIVATSVTAGTSTMNTSKLSCL